MNADLRMRRLTVKQINSLITTQPKEQPLKTGTPLGEHGSVTPASSKAYLPAPAMPKPSPTPNVASSVTPQQLEANRATFKPEIVWNVEKGLALTGQDIMNAMVERSEIYRRANTFFSDFDLILTPATVVPPYPVEQRFVQRVGDHEFSNYIEWCSIASAFTVLGAPAMSVPCGFTQSGLPVGLQIAAPLREEARLLAAASALENLLRLSDALPIDPRAPDS